MLDRNKRIKPRPERFQNCKDLFDLILTCEERVYDQVVEGETPGLSCPCVCHLPAQALSLCSLLQGWQGIPGASASRWGDVGRTLVPTCGALLGGQAGVFEGRWIARVGRCGLWLGCLSEQDRLCVGRQLCVGPGLFCP